jgi:hypothetical protein
MIKEKRQIVEAILKRNIPSRDSDNVLLAEVWRDEYALKSLDDDGYIAFLVSLHLGQLSTPESITRVRRKLQETNPLLRGDKYKKRHSLQETVKEELRGWND